MKKETPRKKRYATKVKTGCITCRSVIPLPSWSKCQELISDRIRRVKCDEGKPTCYRCTSTGRNCDGYELPAEVVSRRLALYPMPSRGSDAESQAIYQFRTRIATLIASSFDAKFWTHDVLHKADTYTPVRHALAALASAYQKSILLGIQSASCDRFIFCQYDKAIKSLYTCFQERKVLATSEKLAALVANFLFTYLCSLQGLRQEALVHLKNGLALIYEWRDLKDHGETMMVDILGLYMRLDTQTLVISPTQIPRLCYEDRSLQASSGGKYDVSSVCPLLRRLDAIHSQLLRPPQKNDPYNYTLPYEQSLTVWDLQFQNITVSSEEEEKHVTALKMRRVMVEVTRIVTGKYSSLGGSVDTHCQTILDLAVQLIHELGLRPAQAGFYLANGLVEALYFVAVTSADWDLRQQAIDILRRYRFTDGVWGSHAAARLAEDRLQSDIHSYRQRLGT
ncbi:transcriptional regulatory moc3 [Fusarium beomiforme]|uniref:Transcriptional regulatory moc3 n=1 Tax=Fusarium beomiforme TaxID=44412 RepID=A0A9P5ABV5_9HYPO|nr:transcriptional regulatory moc3 [Fusarium beomiforme]